MADGKQPGKPMGKKQRIIENAVIRTPKSPLTSETSARNWLQSLRVPTMGTAGAAEVGQMVRNIIKRYPSIPISSALLRLARRTPVT